MVKPHTSKTYTTFVMFVEPKVCSDFGHSIQLSFSSTLHGFLGPLSLSVFCGLSKAMRDFGAYYETNSEHAHVLRK